MVLMRGSSVPEVAAVVAAPARKLWSAYLLAGRPVPPSLGLLTLIESVGGR